MSLRTHLWRFFVIFALLLSALSVVPVRAAKQPDSLALLQSMSAEEKVGQLFLVTFNGSQVDDESQIFDLITNYHIGGVVLLAENNNFVAEDTVANAYQMISALQQTEWIASQQRTENTITGEDETLSYIPLYVGLKQIGDGFPGDQILSGLTPMPSQMAVGASWDRNLAQQLGQVLGRELAQLGVNLYLGPNLDVLETANSEAASSLGVNTYGGDPFWVGEMGKAFISGLHTGAENRVMVVAQNFPGTGNSDRSPEFEIPTVRKSLEQLKQIELAPYISVITPDVGDPGRIEGVMVSHIRYQGFQGNIRSTTRPISFDSNALQQIMSLEQFTEWRDTGGLIISDNLGAGGIRRFFDPNETNFDAKQVVRNAFLAGNDILYIDNMVATGDLDAYTTLTTTIDFFAQKYREDSAFAKRVDSSVQRILDAKLALYGEFDISNVIKALSVNEDVTVTRDVSFDIAQSAVTLISPTAQEIDTILPTAPLWYEDIIIFTDVRPVAQCAGCLPSVNIGTNALANALLNVYGPQAGGQIQEYNLSSFTFSQLVEVLNNEATGASEFLPQSLSAADWVIFNTLDIDPDYPASNALQRVLAERPDWLANKNVIVFAMGSPTYLDATNITKVTAYYALYSKIPAALDVAARVLMKEITPSGALPVSLKAVGYDLITMTAPDPAQVIRLNLLLPESEETDSGEGEPDVVQTPEPTPMPSFNVGDTLTIRTGQIFDHNQNMVPDGTVVRFNFRISGEPGILQQFETTTSAGVAMFNYRIEAAGGLEISATSEPANQSEILQINISPDGVTSVFAFTPTPLVSPTPTEMPTATATEIPQPTPTPTPSHPGYPTLGEWAVGVIVMAIGGGLAFLIGYLWWGSTRWGLRSALCALIGSLIAYSYLTLGTPWVQRWMEESGTVFVIEIVVVGLLFGWIGGLIWWMRTQGRYPTRRVG